MKKMFFVLMLFLFALTASALTPYSDECVWLKYPVYEYEVVREECNGCCTYTADEAYYIRVTPHPDSKDLFGYYKGGKNYYASEEYKNKREQYKEEILARFNIDEQKVPYCAGLAGSSGGVTHVTGAANEFADLEARKALFVETIDCMPCKDRQMTSGPGGCVPCETQNKIWKDWQCVPCPEGEKAVDGVCLADWEKIEDYKYTGEEILDSNEPKCNVGEIYDSAKKACVSFCKEGYYFDAFTGQCENFCEKYPDSDKCSKEIEEELKNLVPESFEKIEVINTEIGVYQDFAEKNTYTLDGKNYYDSVFEAKNPGIWDFVSKTFNWLCSIPEMIFYTKYKDDYSGQDKELKRRIAVEALEKFEKTEIKDLEAQEKYSEYLTSFTPDVQTKLASVYLRVGRMIRTSLSDEEYAKRARKYMEYRQLGDSPKTINQREEEVQEIYVGFFLESKVEKELVGKMLEESYQKYLLAKEMGRKE